MENTTQTPAQTDQAKLAQDPARTKMVAPQPEKKVKLKILRTVVDPRGTDKVNPTMLAAGSIVELPVKVAKELLNRKYPGMYEFSGERESTAHDAKKGVIRVAERYVEPIEEETNELEPA